MEPTLNSGLVAANVKAILRAGNQRGQEVPLHDVLGLVPSPGAGERADYAHFTDEEPEAWVACPGCTAGKAELEPGSARFQKSSP